MGGCLHGPSPRLGLCPNCGTMVDEAELARVKELACTCMGGPHGGYTCEACR